MSPAIHKQISINQKEENGMKIVFCVNMLKSIELPLIQHEFS